MKILVGVLCYNAVASLRHELVEQTVDSILVAFPTAIIELHDNCSPDGATGHLLRQFRKDKSERLMVVHHTAGEDMNTTPGAGRNRMMRWVEHNVERGFYQPELMVFSDDDVAWKPGAEEKLVKFWSGNPPEELMILNGILEPLWHWNTPRRAIESGGIKAVVRDSCPGAAMTFPLVYWNRFGPVIDDFGYDYEACCRLRDRELEVGALDIAEHIGWGCSTHENEAIDATETRPFDKGKWGLE